MICNFERRASDALCLLRDPLYPHTTTRTTFERLPRLLKSALTCRLHPAHQQQWRVRVGVRCRREQRAKPVVRASSSAMGLRSASDALMREGSACMVSSIAPTADCVSQAHSCTACQPFERRLADPRSAKGSSPQPSPQLRHRSSRAAAVPHQCSSSNATVKHQT